MCISRIHLRREWASKAQSPSPVIIPIPIQASASDTSYDGILANVRLGAGLTIMKGKIPHGSFLREVKQRLGIERAWCARLQRLAEEWPNILEAFAWAKNDSKARKRPRRSEYSVASAFATLRSWRNATAGIQDLGAEGTNKKPRANKKPNADRPSNIEQLSRVEVQNLLAEAEHRLDVLRSELARRGEQAGAEVPPVDQTVIEQNEITAE